MYSIIRCIDPTAKAAVSRQIDGDRRKSKRYNCWFTTSHDYPTDFESDDFFFQKLEEMGKGQVFDNPYTTTSIFKPISGTIKC